MILPLVAAVLYMALSVRIRADARLIAGKSERRIRVKLHVFGISLTLDAAPAGGFAPGKCGVWLGRLRRGRGGIAAIMRAFDWERIELYSRLGVGDAAATAQLAGLMHAALASALAAAGAGQCHIRVTPEFLKLCFSLYGRIVCSFAWGDLLMAAAKQRLYSAWRSAHIPV